MCERDRKEDDRNGTDRSQKYVKELKPKDTSLHKRPTWAEKPPNKIDFQKMPDKKAEKLALSPINMKHTLSNIKTKTKIGMGKKLKDPETDGSNKIKIINNVWTQTPVYMHKMMTLIDYNQNVSVRIQGQKQEIGDMIKDTPLLNIKVKEHNHPHHQSTRILAPTHHQSTRAVSPTPSLTPTEAALEVMMSLDTGNTEAELDSQGDSDKEGRQEPDGEKRQDTDVDTDVEAV